MNTKPPCVVSIACLGRMTLTDTTDERKDVWVCDTCCQSVGVKKGFVPKSAMKRT